MVAKVVMKAVRMWNRRFCCWLLEMECWDLESEAYSWNPPGHGVKGERGDQHDHEDDPEIVNILLLIEKHLILTIACGFQWPQLPGRRWLEV